MKSYRKSLLLAFLLAFLLVAYGTFFPSSFPSLMTYHIGRRKRRSKSERRSVDHSGIVEGNNAYTGQVNDSETL